MATRRRLPPELVVAVLLALLLGVANSALAAQPLVYECGADGIRTFSDRPCGDDARPRRVGATTAPQTAPTVESHPRGVTGGSPSQRLRAAPHPAQRPAPRAARRSPGCHELQQQVDRIDSRMRMGYRNKAGEKLKDQRRTLTDEYAARRCNTTARRAPAAGRSP